MEKWRQEAINICGELYDTAMYETLEETLSFAKDILNMFNESGTSFYNNLHYDESKDQNINKQARSEARKEVTKLKNFIKKYGGKTK